MKWFKKKFKPSTEWEHVAKELGGRYRAGSFLESGVIEWSHLPYPVSLSVQNGDSDRDENLDSYTKFASIIPLIAEARMALAYHWPGIGMVKKILSLKDTGTNLKIPGLEKEYLALSSHPQLAEKVLNDKQLIDLISGNSNKMKIHVGGDLMEWKANEEISDIYMLVPGVITDKDQLSYLFKIFNCLISLLELHGCIRKK